MFRSLKFLLPVLAIFLSHYVAANAYAAICAPLSLKGLLWSFFTTSSPVCTLLLGVTNYTSNNFGLLLAGLLASGLGLLGSVIAKPAPARAEARAERPEPEPQAAEDQ